MSRLADNDICNGCEACANVCPTNSIDFKLDTKGFYYPIIDLDTCINCGLCEKKCPLISPSNTFRKIQYNDSICYGGYLKDKEQLKQSSSGGVFTGIAQKVLSRGGKVYGVRYSDDFKQVYYASAETESDLEHFRGSKYVLARKYFVYREVKRELKKGTFVAFFGLPCEIGALYAVLGKDFENLLTVELVCAGTGSYHCHTDFLEKMEKIYGASVLNFSYRYKRDSWLPRWMLCEFSNGDKYQELFDLSEIGTGIKYYKRISCFSCRYKDERRLADITIGDFWKLSPNSKAYNYLGSSVVFPRTDKGLCVIRDLDNMELIKMPVRVGLESNNQQLKYTIPVPTYRADYETVALREGFNKANSTFVRRKSLKDMLAKNMPGKFYFYLKKIGYLLKHK